MADLDLSDFDFDADLNAYVARSGDYPPGVYKSPRGWVNVEIIRQGYKKKTLATLCDPNPSTPMEI